MRTGRSRRLPAVAALALAAAIAVAGGAPAGAGSAGSAAVAPGSSLAPVKDRYEAGEAATLVGYVLPVKGSGWVEDGPFYARLVVDGEPVSLGAVSTQHPPSVPGALRVVAEFRVPRSLDAGHYEVNVCNDPCTTSLGDLGTTTLDVAVDPVRPISRVWPADEPALADLPAGAVVVRPAGSPPTTAATTAVTTAVTTARTTARTAPSASVATARPAVAKRVRIEVKTAKPLPERRHVRPVALAVGGAVVLACVGWVVAALRQE